VETFNNGRLGLCVAEWLHKSYFPSADLACRGLGYMPALFVTTSLLKANAQIQPYLLLLLLLLKCQTE